MDKETFTSWSRAYASRSWRFEPVSQKDVLTLFEACDEYGVIPRGLGNSYGDQALNTGGGIVSLQSFVNEKELVVSDQGCISVTGGTSYEMLLSACIRQGWIVPVVPGSKSITIGGAIAADAHGKNHFHQSSISSCLIEMDVLIANGKVVKCSRSHESELFWATVGGLGLTGLILRASIQLGKNYSNNFNVQSGKYSNFEQLFEQFKETTVNHPYSVAWLDLVSKKNAGRGVIQSASPILESSETFSYKAPKHITIPKVLPFNVVNKVNGGVYNAIRFNSHPSGVKRRQVPIPDFLHPLDRVKNWNNLYGKKGFFQWQIVVPETEELLLNEIIKRLNNLPLLPTLAVLKRLGSESDSYLSFCKPGWTLAIDFPFTNISCRNQLNDFDRELAKAGGRIYLAKDGGVNPEFLNEMYPRLREWKQIRKKFDPDNVWQSDLSRRLHLA